MLNYFNKRLKRKNKEKTLAREKCENPGEENIIASSELNKPVKQYSANKDLDKYCNTRNMDCTASSELLEPAQPSKVNGESEVSKVENSYKANELKKTEKRNSEKDRKTDEICNSQYIHPTASSEFVEPPQGFKDNGEMENFCDIEDKDLINSNGLEDSLQHPSDNEGSSELRNIYLQLLCSGYFDRILPSSLGCHLDTTFMSCDKVEDQNNFTDSTDIEVCGEDTIKEVNKMTISSNSNQTSEINETNPHTGEVYDNTDLFINKANLCDKQEFNTNASSLKNKYCDDQTSKIEKDIISDNYYKEKYHINHDVTLKTKNYDCDSKIIHDDKERDLHILNSEIDQLLEKSSQQFSCVSNQNTSIDKYSGKDECDVRSSNDNYKYIERICEKSLLSVSQVEDEEFESMNQKQNYQQSTFELINGSNSNVQLDEQNLSKINEKNISNLFRQRFLKNLRGTDDRGISKEAHKASEIAGLGFSKCLKSFADKNDELRKLLVETSFSKIENVEHKRSHNMTFLMGNLENSDSEAEFFQMTEISQEEVQARLNNSSRNISELIDPLPREPKNKQITVVTLKNSKQKEMIIRRNLSDLHWSNWLLEMNSDAVLEMTATTDKYDKTINTLTLNRKSSSIKSVLII